MSLKMAALCLDASLEILRPLCCHRTHRLQGDFCRCPHKGSPQALQTAVTFSAHHVLQNNPHFIVQGFRSAHPESQFSALMKASRFLRSHPWVVLAFWAGTESCWKTHSWPLKKVILWCFTTPCSMSSWYTRTPVSPLSCKNEDVVTELMARPSINLPPINAIWIEFSHYRM